MAKPGAASAKSSAKVPTVTKAAPSRSATPTPILVQRKCACGGTPGADGECAECRKKRLGLQTKLTLGEPGDRFEREADRLAARVVGGARAGAISRVQAGAQRSASAEASGGTIGALPPIGVGRPLPAATRLEMEAGLGHDFSRVRIHDGPRAAASARQLGARAYTAGRKVVFGDRQLDTGSRAGRLLLAHELVHVAQQGAAPPLNGAGAEVSAAPAQRVQRAPAPSTAVPPDREDEVSDLEQEAAEPSASNPRAISPDVPKAVPFPREELELVPIHAKALPGQFVRYEAYGKRIQDLAPGPVYWRVTASAGVKKVMKVLHRTRDSGASEPRKLTRQEIEERKCNVIELRFEEALARFGGEKITLEVGGEPFTPGGGDESVDILIRGVQGGRYSDLERAGKAGDTAKVESLVGAKLRVNNCDPDQEKTVIAAWGGAVSLASKALARLDAAKPEELLRKKLFTQEDPVRQALRRNFFPNKGPLRRLDVDEVKNVINEIKPVITHARNQLLLGGSYQCSTDCATGTCARPEAAASTPINAVPGITPVNVCHPFFECSDHAYRVRALFHEAIHQQGVVTPPQAERYRWDKDAWERLRTQDTLKMADAYALFIWEVVKGKKSYGSLI